MVNLQSFANFAYLPLSKGGPLFDRSLSGMPWWTHAALLSTLHHDLLCRLLSHDVVYAVKQHVSSSCCCNTTPPRPYDDTSLVFFSFYLCHIELTQEGRSNTVLSV